MSSILETVEWGKPAQTLLSYCNQVNPELPIIMHIRHTERPKATEETMKQAQKNGTSPLYSTERGKQAAYEFGQKLPKNKIYNIYHSPVKRTIETAEKIHEGLLSQKAVSKIKGVFFSANYNKQKQFEYLKRDIIDSGQPNARQYFINHVNGHFPPWEIEPALLVAKRHAFMMMKNVKNASPENWDIYVSHDTVCSLFLFYWFGVMPDERWIEFLDGFIMQLSDDRMHVFTKDGKKEAYYPYWWNFKRLE